VIQEILNGLQNIVNLSAKAADVLVIPVSILINPKESYRIVSETPYSHEELILESSNPCCGP
jgi:hypothetical protein